MVKSCEWTGKQSRAPRVIFREPLRLGPMRSGFSLSLLAFVLSDELNDRCGDRIVVARNLIHDGVVGAAFEFFVFDVLVSGGFHGGDEVDVLGGAGGFVLTSGDIEEGREFGAGVIARRGTVDDAGGFRDAAFTANGGVGDHLAADRDESGNVVYCEVVLFKVAGIHHAHGGEVGSGGMTGDEDVIRVSTVCCDILFYPCEAGDGVFDIGGKFCSW